MGLLINDSCVHMVLCSLDDAADSLTLLRFTCTDTDYANATNSLQES